MASSLSFIGCSSPNPLASKPKLTSKPFEPDSGKGGIGVLIIKRYKNKIIKPCIPSVKAQAKGLLFFVSLLFIYSFEVCFVANTIFTFNLLPISKTSTNKSYKFFCNFPGYETTFFEDNKTDILNGLRVLFPDSTIEFKFFLRDNKEQIKEFSVIDESMKQYVTRQYNNDYINIDWS
jgi:hypothetical protein